MLTLDQLQPFEFFKYFRLVTPGANLSGPISNVVIMEYESIYGDYSGFSEGDFVLTSLFFARENPNLIYDAFSNLIRKKVCGIAIKEICFDTLPQEVLDLAASHQLPIFFFRDCYMEDIILEINGCQKKISKNEYFEKMIQDILTDKPRNDMIHTLLMSLHAPSASELLSAYVVPKNSYSALSQRRLNKIIFDSSKQEKRQYDCFPYKEGMFFFFYPAAPMSPKASQLHIMNILETLNLTQNMNIYICDISVPLDQFIVSLQNCFYTYQLHEQSDAPCSCYSLLGTKKLLRPLFSDSTTMDLLHNMHDTILSYDSKNDMQLLETLIQYVQNHFEIRSTAEVMYQHPNTIRYRIGKIQQLLDLENIQSFYLFSILLVEMHLYFSDKDNNLL